MAREDGAPAFALPRDPDVQAAALIVIASVGLLVLFGRVFRDVNPA